MYGFLTPRSKTTVFYKTFALQYKKEGRMCCACEEGIWSIVTLVVKLMWSHKEIVSFRLWEERGKVAYSRSKLPLPFIKVLWKQKGIFI